jgi:hypothetical protein
LYRKAVQCGRDGSCVKFRQRNGEKNFKCDLCMKCVCQKFSQYFLTMNKNIGALMCVLIILWDCRTTVYQNPLREIIRTTFRVIGKGCSGERRHLLDPEAAHYETTNEDSAYFFLRRGRCSLRIHPTRPKNQRGLLSGNVEGIRLSLFRK